MSFHTGRNVLAVLASVTLLLLLSAAQANAQCVGGSQQNRARPRLTTQPSSVTPYQYAALQQYQYAVQQYAVQQQQNALLAAALQQQQQNALLAAALLQQQQNALGAQLRAR